MQEFQPTLPRGERRLLNDPLMIVVEFQPTLPRGERRDAKHPASDRAADFNPRSREGSDCFYGYICDAI